KDALRACGDLWQHCRELVSQREGIVADLGRLEAERAALAKGVDAAAAAPDDSEFGKRVREADERAAEQIRRIESEAQAASRRMEELRQERDRLAAEADAARQKESLRGSGKWWSVGFW